MNIPEYVKIVLDELEGRGFDAYLVGGCVRDDLRGEIPSDYDIATNALPCDVKAVFKNFQTIATGEKHGTVTVVSEGGNIEITTYRVDGEYTDLRRPETVRFTKKIEDDLARRDFTMNAIAYNGKYTDPFGGRADIENRIIRTVGDANERFNEDALRILRALRFASTTGFEIEERTKESIHENRLLIKNISAERIYAEFKKLIMGEYAERILLDYKDVIGVFAPCILPCIGFDQKNKYHIYDVYTHMVKAMCYAPFDLKIRLAAFFHDVGKPDCFTVDEKCGHFKGHDEISVNKTKEVLDFLRVDNDTKNDVVMLIREHQREILPEKKYVKRFLSKFSYECFDMLMMLKIADTKAHSSVALENLKTVGILKELKEEIKKDGECISLKDLDINGNDIKNMGIEDGVKIGETLKKLLNMVIDGDVENTKEELIKTAKAL